MSVVERPEVVSAQSSEAKALRIAEEVFELSESERQKWIINACEGDASLLERVEKILQAADSDEHLSTATTQRIVSNYVMPIVVPNYHILRLIGSGGMGDVYEAERIDGEFAQKVAIKVVKTVDSHPRLRDQFLMERQILATMHHPNIVTLLDGGTTEDGLPFFITEFVEGTRLDQYIEKEHPNLAERLELFDQICAAVEYAHASLVIHRDLKPSNVLVQPDGVPKLLDFGIASVLSNDADHRTLIGALTPTFASPEQVSGQPLSTATDVYSLGAILYYMLTESVVYDTADLSQLEAFKLVVNGRAEKPSDRVKSSRQGGSLPGELDAVVLKALAVDPERRYRSVGALRDDLRNFVENRPVSAKLDSRWYRVRKFIVRHKVGFGTTVASILVLVAALVVSLQQNQRANEQLVKANVIAEFMGDLLMSPASRWDVDISAGPDARMSEVLAMAGQHIDQELADFPDVQVKLLSRVAVALERLSMNDQSVALSQRAMDIAHSIDSPELRLEALIAHGKNLTRRGRSEIGLSALFAAKKMLEEQGDERTVRYIYLLNDIGNALGLFERFDEQLATINKAIDMFHELVGDEGHPALAGALNHQSGVLIRMGRLEEARASNDQALSVVALPRNKDEVVRAYVHMYAAALNLVDLRLEEAEKHARVSIPELERLLGKETKEHGVAHARLSLVQLLRGDLEGARQSLLRSQAITNTIGYAGSRDQTAAEILLASHDAEYQRIVAGYSAKEFLNTSYPLAHLSLFEFGAAHIKTGREVEGYEFARQAYEGLGERYSDSLLHLLDRRIAELSLDRQRIAVAR